jgi:hypothetical protein
MVNGFTIIKMDRLREKKTSRMEKERVNLLYTTKMVVSKK